MKNITTPKDAFDVLPNELLFKILKHHLPGLWRVVCKRVCQRWRLILLFNNNNNNKRETQRLGHPTDFAAELAKGGHLNVLQWARSQGCPWTARLCDNAALGGHLEVLQWVRNQGCPWDERTCADAALGGHLEVLQWLRSQGCPWDVWTCIYAAAYGHTKVLDWARAQGCPWNEHTPDIYHVWVIHMFNRNPLLYVLKKRKRTTLNSTIHTLVSPALSFGCIITSGVLWSIAPLPLLEKVWGGRPAPLLSPVDGLLLGDLLAQIVSGVEWCVQRGDHITCYRVYLWHCVCSFN